MTIFEQNQYDRQVVRWLALCATVVFGMILLGGVTRLTHSGLSMVDWRPLVGVIPPIGEQEWLATFDKYKQFPEYQKINKGMSLDGFKVIFMYEYLHRVLGRFIGVLFAIPFFYFALRKRLRPGLTPHLFVLLTMGGLQGLLGWYMVKSGLVDNPRVSQYRLAAHLGVAVVIYTYMVWLVLELRPAAHTALSGLTRYARWSPLLVGLVYLMILSGALVAGTRAGLVYPTWPLMGDSFVPPGLYAMNPAWLAAFEDVVTIQFNHRMFAYLLFLVLNLFAFQVYRHAPDRRVRTAAVILAAVLWMQVVLGISALLQQVPVWLGAAHQGGAVLLLTAMLYLSHCVMRAKP